MLIYKYDCLLKGTKDKTQLWQACVVAAVYRRFHSLGRRSCPVIAADHLTLEKAALFMRTVQSFPRSRTLSVTSELSISLETLLERQWKSVTLQCLSGSHVDSLINYLGIENNGHHISYLDLSYSEITNEQLAQIIAACPNLKTLNLSECRALTELPESIVNLTQLTELNLSYCFALTELPESLEGLTQLTELNLSGCGSLTHLPDSLGDLTQLTELNLSWCGSLTHLPNSLVSLTQLTLLNLSEVKFDLRENNVMLLLWIIDRVLGEKLAFRRLEDGTRVSAFDRFEFEPTLPFYIQAMTQYIQRNDIESFTHLLHVFSPNHDVLDGLCNVLIQQFPQDETAKTFYGRLGLYKYCFDNSNYICPITRTLMRSPVIAASGHSYENSDIMHWLKQSDKDPKTNEPLPNTNLIPNLVLQSQIDESLCAETLMSKKALDSIMRDWDSLIAPDLDSDTD